MRHLLFVIVSLVVFSFPLYSQQDTSGHIRQKNESDEIKTLFKGSADHKVTWGYFIAPQSGYTMFSDQHVFMGGLSFGATVNHFFSVGLSGYAILNSGNLFFDHLSYDTASPGYNGGYLYGGYGGLLLEFTVLPRSPVHVSFPVLIGGGGLTYISESLNVYKDHDWYEEFSKDNIDWDAFFFVQPGVMLEMNLVKFFRLGVGVSYRYTPDLDLVNTSPNLINQFNANLVLKFGKF